MKPLSVQLAELEADHTRLQTEVQRLHAIEAERDELLRSQLSAVPEPARREIYRRGYRAGYSSARRCTERRGPYKRTRELVDG